MIHTFFLEQVKNNFPFTPTGEQESAFNSLNNFLFDRNPQSLFILKGYAGTGKSSLVGALVKTMSTMKQKAVLLAPTGRAAKVFAAFAGQAAFTIHKKIYRQKTFSDPDSAAFSLADNLHQHTLFIADEASMIANDGLDSSSFGTGRLLDDLIHYVYSGTGCRLILLGDTAQLPPVSQSESPALDAAFLRGYGLDVQGAELKQVVRQAEKSGILVNATRLRTAIDAGKVHTYPKIRTQSFPDVLLLRNDELVEAIDDCYHRDGMDETIVISRSNKRANLFNNGIRNRILWREEQLSSGDLLMAARNNYFWAASSPEMSFIANGDLLEVRRIRRTYDRYDFHFCDLTAYFPDYGLELDLKILLETLDADAPALPKPQNEKLFQAVWEDYADLPTKKERFARLKTDPHYNVLQVKYAYALTCHKSQGGQWKNVFLDLSYVPEHYLGLEFYRWLYTAFTRATERIYLVNPVGEMLE
jgi:exodeoxyribonuclease-5